MSEHYCEDCGRPVGPILLSFLDGPDGNETDVTEAVVAGRRVICQDCSEKSEWREQRIRALAEHDHDELREAYVLSLRRERVNARPYTKFSHPELSEEERERRNDEYQRVMAAAWRAHDRERETPEQREEMRDFAERMAGDPPF